MSKELLLVRLLRRQAVPAKNGFLSGVIIILVGQPPLPVNA